MGYIKKLKNNELVGGTDKTTIYPVTSAEAVFEEVSDNEFKSQKYLNNHITNERIVDNTIENSKLKDDTIDMGKLNTQLKTIIQNAYDASWKVKKEPFSLETKYDANDVVYDPDTNSSYVSLTADNQGNPVNPEDEGYVEGKWRIVINGISAIESTEVINAKVEELETEVDNKIDDAQDQLDAKIADVQVQLNAVTKEATDAAIEARDAASTVETLTSQQVADAQVGYFECTNTAASGAAANETKITTTDTIGTSAYTKTVGSDVKIKMAVANTHAAPVYLQFGTNTATSAQLYYNGLPVSASNTWEEGEVISVYFDGTNYQASNAQGGGGKAEKIKYDNSQSGLAAENVQGALDEIQGNSMIVTTLNQETDIETGNYRITSQMKWYTSSADKHYWIPCNPGDVFRLTGGETNTSYIFTTQHIVSSNSKIYPCSIYTSSPILNANETVEVAAPSDAAYLIINKVADSNDVSPSVIKTVVYVKPKELKVEIENIEENEIKTYAEIPFSNIEIDKYRLTSTKAWTNPTQDTQRHYWLPCRPGDTFKLTAGENSFNYAFLHSHNNTGNIAADVSSIYEGVDCPVCYPKKSVTVTCPTDAIGLAFNKFVSSNDTKIEKVELVTTVKEDIAHLREDIESVNEKTQILGRIRSAECIGANGIRASDGTLATSTIVGHTDYLPTNGAEYVFVKVPAIQSYVHGLAFYGTENYSTYISGIAYKIYSEDEYVWKLIEVPQSATCFRTTTKADTDTQYRLVVTTDYLLRVFNDSAANCLASHIFRTAKVVSPKEYIYAFGISQMCIIDNKAYIMYDGNQNSVDGDSWNNSNSSCQTVVDLYDLSSSTAVLENGTMYNSDGSTASPYSVQYGTYCASPDGKIASLAEMRFKNNNPCYSYQLRDTDSTVRSFKKCVLEYQNNDTTVSVDFTINNYRQMIYDLGYKDSYIASSNDVVDNINLHYNEEKNVYYAVLGTAQISASSANKQLPLVLMQSDDMATWYPVTSLNKITDACEISAIYKGDIVYVCYRSHGGGMRYIIYDVENSSILRQGIMSQNDDLVSKPDTFTFNNDVYMAVNVDPSVFGIVENAVSYRHDARNQIAIYKIVGDEPILFKTVCNPTGLQYFSFIETPTEMIGTTPAPIYEHGAIYIAFSEDRRHLYRRQIANVSFADVTALFAENGRVI